MNSAVKRILDIALTLDPEQRLYLAERLIESMGTAVDAPIEQANPEIVETSKGSPPKD